MSTDPGGRIAAGRRLCILFAGGGTGGHLFPALAIAEEIVRLQPGARCVFVGTAGKIEARVVPSRGFRFETIWISGFRRRLSAETLLFPLKVAVAAVQSAMLLRRIRPAVVVGTGGYVSGPVVLVASLLGVPTLLQEQNSVPGATTKMLASRVTEVHLTFPGSERHFRETGNLHLSGNPTGSAIGSVRRPEGAAYFGIEPARTTVLLFGGSQGASSLNAAMLQHLPALTGRGVQVIWQTGEREFDRIREALAGMGDSVRCLTRAEKFIEHMEFAYAACDLAVSRAGATAVAELARAGVPAILVPYPFAAGDHQTQNAASMVEAGGAVMIPDRDITARLPEVVTGLLDDPRRLSAMAVAARRVAKPEATLTLARAVLRLAGEGDG